MVAAGRIAAAAHIELSYSSGGANMHSYRSVNGSLGPSKSVDKWHPAMFSRFAGLTILPNTCRQTHTDQAAPSVAIGRISAMHAMRPNYNNNKYQLSQTDPRDVGYCRTRIVL